ncbi:hypothetical protein KKC22_12635 [Myxococcota bacterium]|nr:hypothetical protein [Myxococcota bacterium]MBU1558166.1 hypothetical protein [Patescibacteria group bacterium]
MSKGQTRQFSEVFKNVVTGRRNAIVGGENNSIIENTISATITGGNSNTISNSRYSSILGGYSNEIAGDYSTTLGGNKNRISSDYSSIIGGKSNLTTGQGSVIVSGVSNSAVGAHALVLGGERNFAGGEFASVLNGYGNNALGKHAMVSTGSLNSAKGDFSFIATGGGGTCGYWRGHFICNLISRNVAEGKYSTILGGYSNNATGTHASIISGSSNTAPGYAAVVVGGGGSGIILPGYEHASLGNSAVGSHSVVVGGMENRSYGNYSAILSGGNNETHGRGSAVCGGGGIILDIGDEQFYNPGNIGYGDFSLVAGGEHNRAGKYYKDENYVFHSTGDNAVAVGGKDNGAYAPRSCAVGGRGNSITYGEMGSTLGGAWNQVSGQLSVIVGGQNNVSAGYATLVSGGMHNWAFDYVSAIFGGLFNVAGVPINGNFPFKLYNIDTDILSDRAGMTTVGGYRNRAFDNISTVVGGTRNVAGHVPQNEDYCVQCSSCFSLAPVTVHDNGPLVSIIPHDCSCLQECYTSNMTTSAATITGGNDNHLASYLQNGLYYPWIAGYGFEYSYLGSGSK